MSTTNLVQLITWINELKTLVPRIRVQRINETTELGVSLNIAIRLST